MFITNSPPISIAGTSSLVPDPPLIGPPPCFPIPKPPKTSSTALLINARLIVLKNSEATPNKISPRFPPFSIASNIASPIFRAKERDASFKLSFNWFELSSAVGIASPILSKTVLSISSLLISSGKLFVFVGSSSTIRCAIARRLALADSDRENGAKFLERVVLISACRESVDSRFLAASTPSCSALSFFIISFSKPRIDFSKVVNSSRTTPISIRPKASFSISLTVCIASTLGSVKVAILSENIFLIESGNCIALNLSSIPACPSSPLIRAKD